MAHTDQSLLDRRVLVTGAYGLLGSAVVAAALEAGARVSTLSRERHEQSALVTGALEGECDGHLVDVCDENEVRRVFASSRPDVVIHLAGVAVVGDARVLPREAIRSSVLGTLNILEESRTCEPSAVIVASSDKAYGASERLPYTEQMPLAPKFPYEAAKAAADVIARSYWFSFGLPVAVIRSANLYGPGDTNSSRLVPQTIGSILNGCAPVVRSDGSPERDYLYVQDAAAAYLSLAGLLEGREGVGEAFNVGSGDPRTALEVVRALIEIAGLAFEPDIQGAGVPEGEIERQSIDSSKLSAATGWQVRTGLADGLARTLDWYRAHPGALGL